MTKLQFEKIINDGITNDKVFMILKIIDKTLNNPKVAVFLGSDIETVRNKCLDSTNRNMQFLSNGNYIDDVIMSDNLNDISWFLY